MTIPVLVNLTGEPVYVVGGGKLLALADAPPPRAIEMSAKQPAKPLTVEVAGLEVQLAEQEMVCPLMSGPPELDGVVWLVTAEVLAAFPHRRDFVRPALYRLVGDDELAELGGAPGREPGDGNDAATGDDDGFWMVLHTVTRTRLVVAADAVSIHDLDETGTADGDEARGGGACNEEQPGPTGAPS